MNKSIIILFVALALLQLVRSEDEKPAEGGSSPVQDAVKQVIEGGQKAADQVKDAITKSAGQVQDALKSLNPLGGAKASAPKEA